MIKTLQEELQDVPLVTKADALRLLSDQLRKRGVKSEEFIKVLSLYSKLQGWDKDDEPRTPCEEVSLDKLVAAIEKKRRGH